MRSRHVGMVAETDLAARAVVANVLVLTAVGSRLSVTSAGQSVPRHVREVTWNLNVRIADVVRPDDEVIELTRDFLEVAAPKSPLSVHEVAEDVAVRADLVALVDASSVDTVLSQNESWIDTRVTGTIREILRASESLHFQPGQPLDMRISGGERLFGTVVVRAGDRAPVTVPRVIPHVQYFVFLKRSQDAFSLIHPLLVVENQRVKYLSRLQATNIPSNPLEGLSVQELVRIVRDARSSWVLEGNWQLERIGL